MEKFLPPVNRAEIIEQVETAMKEYAWKCRDYNFTCRIDIECDDFNIRAKILD